MCLGLFYFKYLSKSGKTVSEHYQKVFGKRNYEKVLKHAFNGVLSQEAETFPAELLFKSRIRNKNYPRSFTLKGGLKALLKAIVETRKFEIHLEEEVLGFSKEGDVWQVQGREAYTAKKLILATPLSVASKLVVSAGYNFEGDQLTRAQCSSIKTLGVVVKKTKLSRFPLLAGAIGIDQPFYSMVSRDVLSHDQYRGFVFHFKDRVDFDVKKNESYALKVLGVNQIDLVDKVWISQSLPMMDLRLMKQIEVIGQSLQKENLYLVGNYFSRLALEDCVKQSKKIVSLL